MKKSVSVLFCLVLLLNLMVGCGNSGKNNVRPDDKNRPGVTDNVNTDNNGILDDRNNNNTAPNSPNVSNHPVTDGIENGVADAGDAVRRGMNDVGNAVDNATDRMTGR